MYIGTKPQSGFISQEANQYFTGLTQNYIDLNQSISSLSSVIVLVNGVVQENSTMSLTSSTRITLGDTLVSGDKVTCIYVAKISSTQAPGTGTVTNDMLAGSIANSKLATDPLNASNLASGTVPTARLGSGTASSSTFLRGDGSWQSAGGDNTPAFHAYSNSTTTTSHNTATILKMDTEVYDTDGNYDPSSYRFTPTTSGKFFVYMSASYGNTNDFDHLRIIIRKNGSDIAVASTRQEGHTVLNCSTVTAMNGSSDYLETFAFQDSGGNENFSSGSHQTFFGSYKLIGI